MLDTILGTKLGMTQVFSKAGEPIPVTVIKAGPCFVVQKKTTATDGYNALQLGFGTRKQKLINKPLENHLKKANLTTVRYLREVRIADPQEYKLGDKVEAGIFKQGDYVDIRGTSIGKGMAGVMKRYGFSGGPMTHGCTNRRGPGSVGASSFPSRVFKGTRMAGRMGKDGVKVLKLQVIDIREKEGLMIVKGSVPGPKNGFLIISKTGRYVKGKSAAQKSEPKGNK